MKLKYLRKMGQHKAGALVELEDSSAAWLVERGLAEQVEDDPTESELTEPGAPAEPPAATPPTEPPADAKPTRRRRGAGQGDGAAE